MSKRRETLLNVKASARRRAEPALSPGRIIRPMPRLEAGSLEQASGLLAAIVESSQDAIYSKNLEGIVTSWNRGAEHLFGYRAEEIIGKPNAILIPDELLAQEAAITERLRKEKTIQYYETFRRAKSGARLQVSLTISPIKDHRGAVVGAAKIARDISQRKELEESAARLRLVFEAAPNGMVMVDERGIITMVNSQMERLFGYIDSAMSLMRQTPC